MTIDATWSGGVKETVGKIQSKAAMIGGDGVIITDRNINIYAFNRGTTTQGTVWGTRNWLQYQQTTRDNTLYIPQVILYAYVIKFKAEQVTSPNRPSNKMWTAYGDKKILLSEYTFVYIDTKTHLFHLFNCSERTGLANMQLKYALERDYKPCPNCIPFSYKEGVNWIIYNGRKFLPGGFRSLCGSKNWYI